MHQIVTWGKELYNATLEPTPTSPNAVKHPCLQEPIMTYKPLSEVELGKHALAGMEQLKKLGWYGICNARIAYL